MRKIFTADYYFDNIYQITPEFLKSISVDTLTADLDNTIADYDTPEPTEKMKKWFSDMLHAGVKIAIVSNNNCQRVKRFCSCLEGDIPHYWKSGKPGKKTILKAVQTLESSLEHTAMLGDKITTDVLGARICGIKMLKVPSIKPRWKRSVKK